MALNMNIWQVDSNQLKPLQRRSLDQEQRLESWIEADPSLLGLDVLIIGRQVKTAFGGWIDLLALDSEGHVIVIELKRDKTPRDIVAQVLDYASWVTTLESEEVQTIAERYLNGALGVAFHEHFNTALPEVLNTDHQMVIVAAALDDASERIAQYLANEHSININVVFFNVFELDGKELLARSWLLDPEVVEERSESKRKVRWTGIWYVNIGPEEDRCWEDRRKYGFVSAGGAERYSKPLRHLKEGDRFYAYTKGHGYVGYGEVTHERCLPTEFVPEGYDKPLSELPLTTSLGMDRQPGNEDYVVGVKWLDTVPVDQAKWFSQGFANQNIVCRLRDAGTVEFLAKEFGASNHEA